MIPIMGLCCKYGEVCLVGAPFLSLSKDDWVLRTNVLIGVSECVQQREDKAGFNICLIGKGHLANCIGKGIGRGQ